MSAQKSRRKFSIEQKVAILRRHMVDKVAVSDLCDEYKIQPSVFYQWQRQVMENLGMALEGGRRRSERSGREQELMRRIEALDARVAKKDQVIAEISEEYVQLKKELGDL